MVRGGLVFRPVGTLTFRSSPALLPIRPDFQLFRVSAPGTWFIAASTVSDSGIQIHDAD